MAREQFIPFETTDEEREEISKLCEKHGTCFNWFIFHNQKHFVFDDGFVYMMDI